MITKTRWVENSLFYYPGTYAESVELNNYKPTWLKLFVNKRNTTQEAGDDMSKKSRLKKYEKYKASLKRISEKMVKKQHNSQGVAPKVEPTITSVTPVKPKVDPNKMALILQQVTEYHTGFKGDIWKQEFTKPKNYFLQADGIYIVADKPFARLINKVHNINLPGQFKILEPSYILKIPRMPGSFLGQIVSFFRHYVIDEKVMGVSEAFVQIYWDPQDKEYFINVPRQKVSGGRVAYLETPEAVKEQDPRIEAHGCSKVWDIHSHNTMSSFFSTVDDRDERGTQFYGVIGNITADSFTWRFRIGIDGIHADVAEEDAKEVLFDMTTFSEDIVHPKEWEAKVNIQGLETATTTTPATTGGGYPYGRGSYPEDYGYGDDYYDRHYENYGYRAQEKKVYTPYVYNPETDYTSNSLTWDLDSVNKGFCKPYMFKQLFKRFMRNPRIARMFAQEFIMFGTIYAEVLSELTMPQDGEKIITGFAPEIVKAPVLALVDHTLPKNELDKLPVKD